MQFEKWEVGYCGKLFGMRGSQLLAERAGGGGEMLDSFPQKNNCILLNVNQKRDLNDEQMNEVLVKLLTYFF